MQRLVARFLAGGYANAPLDALRREYRRRKCALQQALSDELSGLEVHWTNPQGGFFLWLTLPPEIDTEALFPLALEEGVAYIPGPAFRSAIASPMPFGSRSAPSRRIVLAKACGASRGRSTGSVPSRPTRNQESSMHIGVPSETARLAPTAIGFSREEES